ncbi:hypothetical protein Hanom_Chr10g00934751 [Helianthus anomalus]
MPKIIQVIGDRRFSHRRIKGTATTTRRRIEGAIQLGFDEQVVSMEKQSTSLSWRES